jgi:hypothetical protein
MYNLLLLKAKAMVPSYDSIWEYDVNCVLQKFKILFFLLKINFLCVLNRFDALISKIISKK